MAEIPTCTPKTLPEERAKAAAVHAVHVNPVNAPAPALAGVTITPQHIALLTSKYWGATGKRFPVYFMEPVDITTRGKIMKHLNAWYVQGSNTRFVISKDPSSLVRITREGDGYWSYLGTDVGLIPVDEPTMCLQGFTSTTPDREYTRVVRHEAGHTLGFPHEHMRKAMVARIDPDKAYVYFGQTQGWDKQTVDDQVLTPLSEASVMGTPPQDTSIMCYQIPGSITYSGRPIPGGTDITENDAAFASQVYPRTVIRRA